MDFPEYEEDGFEGHDAIDSLMWMNQEFLSIIF